MADQPFIAEIIIGAFNFAPKGYAFCNGQLIPIAQNTALFSLLGTTYGGNGQTTFALPDLRARTVIGFSQGPGLSPYVLGEKGGQETVTLLQNQMPLHNHTVASNNGDGTQNGPVNNFFAGAGADRDLFWYNAATTGTTTNMNANAIGTAGGGAPHNNLQPYQVVNYCIATQGIFPSRN
ncbi:MAG: tail fiber protein [Chitinophagaceae bacterium]|nr:tail fiber protein [Chitinophagaceae bacterium]